MTKTGINIGPTIANYDGETFLSQGVTISILQESKNAFKRCHVLCTHSDLAGNAEKILCVLIQYLVLEHIDYDVELGIQAIPLPDPKNQPEIYFFDVVGQANTLFHLFEKQFQDSVNPLVLSSPKHSLCIQKRRALREQLKGKIDTGLDRAVATVAGWVRNILSAEQKKTDFKPEDDSVLGQMVTPVGLDKSVLMGFIQLRYEYRTAKLATVLK